MSRLIAVLLLALCIPAFAAVPNAGDLVKCKELAKDKDDSSKDEAKAGWCYGFINGWQAVGGAPYVENGKLYKLRISRDISYGQAARVFVKYVKDHPELENKKTYVVFTWAMIDAGLVRLADWEPTPGW